MIDKIILNGIIAIFSLIVIAYLTKASKKKTSIDENGEFHLKMNKLYGLIGILGTLLGLFFLIYIPLTVKVGDNEIWLLTFFMLLILLVPGIFLLMYYKNHRVIFGDNSIVVTDVFGKEKKIKWSDITDIKFNILSGMFVISTKSEKIKVHLHLIGISNFTEYIERKTGWKYKNFKIFKHRKP